MINPEDNIPLDDTNNAEADDQQSQKDIHSNGFDAEIDPEEEQQQDIDLLNQAFNASEASFTLDPDKGLSPEPEE